MATTTLCPHCKAVCSVPDGAIGKQVACSRCESVFAAAPFLPPIKLRTKPSLHRRMGALVVFLILLGAAGTLAIVAASIVFAIYQVQIAMHPAEATTSGSRGGGGPGFVLVGQDPAEEKAPASEKTVLPPIDLLPNPPELAIPAAAQKPISLSWRPSIGEYSVTLQTWLQGQEKPAAGAAAQLKSRTIAELLESIQAVDPEGQASVRLRYRGYQADSARDGVSRAMPLAASGDLASASAFLLLNDKGAPGNHRLDTTHVPAGVDGPIKKVHEAQRLLFEFFAIPLPNEAAAKPGTEWTYQRQIPFLFSEEDQATRFFDATAILRGSQRVGASDYAVLELRGKLARPKGGEAQDSSVQPAKGWALIDPSTGIVMKADVEIPFAMALSVDQASRSMTGSYRLSIVRRVPPAIEDNN